jgi:hypothetical protein
MCLRERLFISAKVNPKILGLHKTFLWVKEEKMDFKNLINKAKEIAESEKTRDFIKRAADTGNEFTKKTIEKSISSTREFQKSETYKAASEKIDEFAQSDTVKKARDFATKFAGASREKLVNTTKRLLNEIEIITPVLTECGFAVTDLAVVMSVPPGVMVTVKQFKKSEILAQDWLLANPGRLTKFQETLLISVDRAYAVEELAREYHYKMGEILIEMTVPPRVEVHFKPLSLI